MRILLADDHTLFAEALHSLLQERGYEVVGPACNGQEALKLARESGCVELTFGFETIYPEKLDGSPTFKWDQTNERK